MSTAQVSAFAGGKAHRLALNGNDRQATIHPQTPRPPSRPFHTQGGNRRFYKESVRLKSYQVGWPVSFLEPIRMAAAGFFYTQHEDAVRCPFCNIEVGRWERGDDPMVDHGRWAPNCRFVRGIETRNVPIGEESSSDEEGGGYDVCGPGTMPNSSPQYAVPNSALLSDPLELQQNYIKKRAISHPNFSTYDSRLSSYSAWPKSMKLRPHQLADAGLFYTGVGDQTICFHCDGGLKDWEETDDPWIEHAKNFSKCEYLLMAKGREFVEAVLDSQNKLHSKDDNGSSNSASCSSSQPSGIENLAISSANTSRSGSSDAKEETRLCKICYAEEMGAAFIPCGHVVACNKCAPSLATCAVCRKPVQGTLRVFLS